MSELQETDVIAQRETVAPWLWKPGQSGNPAGRPPRGKTMLDRLIEKVERNPDSVVEALYAKLIAGDSRVFELYANRAYGVPKQALQIEGNESPMGQLMNVLAERYMRENGLGLADVGGDGSQDSGLLIDTRGT